MEKTTEKNKDCRREKPPMRNAPLDRIFYSHYTECTQDRCRRERGERSVDTVRTLLIVDEETQTCPCCGRTVRSRRCRVRTEEEREAEERLLYCPHCRLYFARFSDYLRLLSQGKGQIRYSTRLKTIRSKMSRRAREARAEPPTVEELRRISGVILAPETEMRAPNRALRPESRITALVLEELDRPVRKRYILVKDPREEAPERQVLCYTSPLATAFLRARAGGVRAFRAEGKLCRIISFEDTPAFRRLLQVYRDFGSPERPVTVYLCASIRRLPDFEHLEAVSAPVWRLDADQPTLFNLYYSPEEKRYYAERGAYETFVRTYSQPFLALRPAREEGVDRSGWQAQSRLSLYGYTVSAAENLSREERRRLLAGLLDAGLMGKGEITSWLSFLIRQRPGPMYQAARAKWKEDRTFVSDYRISQQRRIWGNFQSGTFPAKKL